MNFKVAAVPAILEFNGKLLKTAVYEIGPWNMDSTSAANVNHNLTISKIVGMQCIIINDARTNLIPLVTTLAWNTVEGRMDILNTSIQISRRTGGQFDNANFDDGVLNRGYIILQYLE